MRALVKISTPSPQHHHERPRQIRVVHPPRGSGQVSTRAVFFAVPTNARLKITADTKVPNAAIVKIEREDHTLANLLRAQLLRDDKVIFAAYKVPHPLFANFELRIQTDEDYLPKEALRNACLGLISELDTIKTRFKDEWALKALLNTNEDEF